MAIEVRDNTGFRRYEIFVDGVQSGITEYRHEGSTLVLPHTLVDPRMRGKGLAALLVRRALDDARANGLVVIPECWYVAEFIHAHAEYADLVTPGSVGGIEGGVL